MLYRYGQLGQNGTRRMGDNANEMSYQLPFTVLGSDALVEQLALGDEHSCALFDNGKVKCWGYASKIMYKIYI